MAAGVNKAILIGHLGRDPEMRYLPDGRAVANFSIATSEQWKDKATGERRERTEWHRIVAFDRLGEICGEYLAKGRQVYIEGRIQTREWEDRDGNKRYTTEIVAMTMQMLGSSRDGGREGGGGGYVADRRPRQDRTRDAGTGTGGDAWGNEAGDSSSSPPPDDDIPF